MVNNNRVERCYFFSPLEASIFISDIYSSYVANLQDCALTSYRQYCSSHSIILGDPLLAVCCDILLYNEGISVRVSPSFLIRRTVELAPLGLGRDNGSSRPSSSTSSSAPASGAALPRGSGIVSSPISVANSVAEGWEWERMIQS